MRIIIIIVEIVMIMIKNNNNIYIYMCVIWNLELYSKKTCRVILQHWQWGSISFMK